MKNESLEDDNIGVDPSRGKNDESIAPFLGGDDGVDRWNLPREVLPCTVYRDSPGSMGRVTTPLGDLNFTNLFGGSVPMMRQLGRQSASGIREGALPFLNQFMLDVVGALVPKPLASAGSWALEHWLLNRLRDSLPSEYLKILRAYGEGSGYSVEEVVSAQLVWEIWALLGRAPIERVHRALGRARLHSPLLDSCSLVLPTNSSGPLHLRWFDNTAIDGWDRKTSVAFFHPDQGIPYVLVSSMGFVTGLPAGMNAAGLTVTVEPGGEGEVDWNGVSLGWATHRVLSGAHTIEEAAALLRQCPSVTPWRYVLCEGDTGRVAVFVSGQSEVEWEDRGEAPIFVAGAEAELPGKNMDRVGRWHRSRIQVLEKVVDEWSGGGHDPVYNALCSITGSIDPERAEPGHPLAGLSNVGAVLFEPKARRLWVAAGRAPVGRRWFVPLSMRSSDGPSGGGLDSRVRPIMPASDWETTEEGRAMDHLRQAYQLDRSGEDSQRILITLEYALALDTQRPSLHILVGLMALRVHRGRRAEGAFRRAIALLDDSTQSAEISVYLAWALDLQRRRSAARGIYGRLVKEPNVEARVRYWARRGKRRRFRERHARKLNIDFFLATVFED